MRHTFACLLHCHEFRHTVCVRSATCLAAPAPFMGFFTINACFTPRNLLFYKEAEVVELADAPDSKSGGAYTPCGFDSRLRHQ